MMEIRPILSAMLRNKTGAILIALQIALTLAIVCNAVFIIRDRLVQIGRPTGMDVDNMFVVNVSSYRESYNAQDAIRTNLDILRGIPGVVDAATSEAIPLSGGGWSDGVTTKPDPKENGVGMGVFHMDEHGLTTLGAKLVEGRDFIHEDVHEVGRDTYKAPNIAIITRAAGEKLWPGQDPLGKQFYEDNGTTAVTVIGVVDALEGYWPHWEGFERQIIFPVVFDSPFTRYIVRTLPGERDRALKEAEQKIGDANTGAYIRSIHPLTYYRDSTYQDDHAMTVVLSVVTGLILAITALGIVGLASFSVRQRTKQIGTRRALGARRIDIVRYFMTENWLITSIGVTAGSIFAVALNFWLVSLYKLPPLSWYYIPVGILCLWLLGLLAVLGPALRAAAIPPAIATRNV